MKNKINVAKIFGVISLVVSSYFLQGCIFVPDGGCCRHEHEHGFYEGGRGWR